MCKFDLHSKILSQLKVWAPLDEGDDGKQGERNFHAVALVLCSTCSNFEIWAFVRNNEKQTVVQSTFNICSEAGCQKKKNLEGFTSKVFYCTSTRNWLSESLRKSFHISKVDCICTTYE